MLMALPGLHYGTWYQSEPVTHALWLGAATIGLGTILGISKKQIPSSYWTHPVVLWPLGIALWSALQSFWAIDSALSWYGTPQLGEGIITYVTVALFTYGFLVLSTYTRLRHLIASIAICLTLVVTTLTLIASPEWPWTPYWFPDYLAFYAIFTSTIALAWLPIKTSWQRITICLTALIIIFLSSNKATIVLACTLSPLMYVLSLKQKSHAKSIRLGMAGAIIAPLAIFLGMLLVNEYMPSSSIWSRQVLSNVVLQALEDTPSALVTGFGWGHYTELLSRHLIMDNLVLFNEAGHWSPNWDGLSHTHFHSHNVMVEALLSTGIIGLLLTWGYFVILPRYALPTTQTKANISIVLLAGTLSAWFQLPGTLAFMAATYAALADPEKTRLKSHTISRQHRLSITLILTLTITTLITATIIQYRTTQETRTLTQTHFTDTTPNLTVFSHPFSHSESYLVHTFYDYVVRLGLSQTPNTQPISSKHIDTLKRYFAILETPTASVRPTLIHLIMHAELAFLEGHPELKSIRQHALDTWEPTLRNFLKHAPRRTDIAAPYLSWKLQQGHEEDTLNFSSTLLDTNPDDPVGLWFSGIVLLANDRTANEGIARMQSALRNGIKRYIPIDATIQQQIESLPSR